MAEAWASIAVADSCTHVIHWQIKCARQGDPRLARWERAILPEA